MNPYHSFDPRGPPSPNPTMISTPPGWETHPNQLRYDYPYPPAYLEPESHGSDPYLDQN